MIQKKIAGVPFLFFNNLLPFRDLLHAVVTRSGGVSSGPFSSLNLCAQTGDYHANVFSNYTIVSRILQFDLSALIILRQVHGNKVATIDETYKKRKAFILKPPLSGFDAMVSKRKGYTLMVRIADCVPIIFFDPAQKIIAVAHAGWRGTIAGIVRETIKEMVARHGSNKCHILAGIGPSIGPCCFCVENDVAELFSNQMAPTDSLMKQQRGRLFLNLWEANRVQLLEQGVPSENIEVAGLCTACHSDLFFSHRREKGKTGRFGALVGLRM